MISDVLCCLEELSINGSPRCSIAGLTYGEALTLWQLCLHVSDSCTRLWHGHCLNIQIDGRHLLVLYQTELLTLQECIHRIHAVYRSIPRLSALLLQQPALHLVDGLEVVWCNHLQSLYGDALGWNLIVEPRVASTWSVIVATHILAINSVLLQRLGILLSALGINLRENNCRKSLVVYALALNILL